MGFVFHNKADSSKGSGGSGGGGGGVRCGTDGDGDTVVVVVVVVAIVVVTKLAVVVSFYVHLNTARVHHCFQCFISSTVHLFCSFSLLKLNSFNRGVSIQTPRYNTMLITFMNTQTMLFCGATVLWPAFYS